jgi:hypothetical protein
MADSRRQDLMDAILARFRLITVGGGYETNLGANVHVWRDTAQIPFQPEELPALNLRDASNAIEQQLTNKHEHSLTILCQGFVASSAVATDVRKCMADLYKAIGVDRKWPSTPGDVATRLAVDTLPVGDEFTVQQNGIAIAGFVLTFVVKFRTTSYDPYTA